MSCLSETKKSGGDALRFKPRDMAARSVEGGIFVYCQNKQAAEQSSLFSIRPKAPRRCGASIISGSGKAVAGTAGDIIRTPTGELRGKRLPFRLTDGQFDNNDGAFACLAKKIELPFVGGDDCLTDSQADSAAG